MSGLLKNNNTYNHIVCNQKNEKNFLLWKWNCKLIFDKYL